MNDKIETVRKIADILETLPQFASIVDSYERRTAVYEFLMTECSHMLPPILGTLSRTFSNSTPVVVLQEKVDKNAWHNLIDRC